MEKEELEKVHKFKARPLNKKVTISHLPTFLEFGDHYTGKFLGSVFPLLLTTHEIVDF